MPRVFKMGPYLVYFWSDERECHVRLAFDSCMPNKVSREVNDLREKLAKMTPEELKASRERRLAKKRK